MSGRFAWCSVRSDLNLQGLRLAGGLPAPRGFSCPGWGRSPRCGGLEVRAVEQLQRLLPQLGRQSYCNVSASTALVMSWPAHREKE